MQKFKITLELDIDVINGLGIDAIVELSRDMANSLKERALDSGDITGAVTTVESIYPEDL